MTLGKHVWGGLQVIDMQGVHNPRVSRVVPGPPEKPAAGS